MLPSEPRIETRLHETGRARDHSARAIDEVERRRAVAVVIFFEEDVRKVGNLSSTWDARTLELRTCSNRSSAQKWW
jgi:hypothetical protein